MWIRFPYCLKLCTLDGRPSRLPCCYVFPTSSRISNCGSTGTSNPEPNSSSPTMTYTHNLLPTIIETESQIPTRVLIQTLIPMVHRGVKSYRCIIMTRAGGFGRPCYQCVSVFVCVAWPVPTSFQGNNMATWEIYIHSSIAALPSTLFHPPSLIPTNAKADGGYDVCWVTPDRCSLSSSILSPGYIPLSKQSLTYIGDDLRWANQDGI